MGFIVFNAEMIWRPHEIWYDCNETTLDEIWLQGDNRCVMTVMKQHEMWYDYQWGNMRCDLIAN